MSKYQGPFFDVDVHNCFASTLELLDYLPERWHDQVRSAGYPPFTAMPPIPDGVVIHHDYKRGDARPEGGGAGSAGSDYETLRSQLLDAEDDYRALLTHQLGDYGGQFNPYFARAIASATNDWTIDRWLSRDERLFAAIVIPLAEPEAAAAEIRRVGGHPQMRAVLFAGNSLSRPIGDPLYHPIYEAAEELGLPIVVHVSGVGRPGGASVAAGGRLTFMHFLMGFNQQGQHYISSLIVHGVFERFPKIRVLLNEFGIGWLPHAMISLDGGYDLLKAESPWVKRLPSEYVREHILLGTQPLEESFDDKTALSRLLETIPGVENMLCFSTDYPHATMDDPRYVTRRLPDAWHDRVMCGNACELFGLPLHGREPAGAVAAA
jgi:predicted TIM-barrel fold metal-dependent hydrolase